MPCPPSLKVVVITVALTALGASSASTPAHGADKSTLSAETSFTVTGEPTGVVAVSSTRAWAVGGTLIGITKVSRSRFPVQSGPGLLSSLVVTGRGRHSAWAAGVTFGVSGANGDVLMHWNGSIWRPAPFPLHGTNENLWSMAAGPGGAVWAVGDSHNNAQTRFTPLSMRGNGTTWHKVAVTAPINSELTAVTFVPGGTGTAWAAGTSASGKRTLILRWTGKAWSQVASPDPFMVSNTVNAIASTSPRDAWAVGAGKKAGAPKTFIVHWNGSAWH